MAFRKDATTAAQTSANVAGSVVTALIEADEVKADDVEEVLESIFDAVFGKLRPVVDADNELFAATEAADTAKPAKSGGKRSGKTGGNRKSSGGGGSSISLDDALSMELTGGTFEGATLGEVLEMPAEETDADYGYGDGERSGRDYVTWLASDKNKNEYTQRRARIIADAEGIDY